MMVTEISIANSLCFFLECKTTALSPKEAGKDGGKSLEGSERKEFCG